MLTMSSADNARLGDMGEYQHTPRGCAECRKLRGEVARLEGVILDYAAVVLDKADTTDGVRAAIATMQAALREDDDG